MGVIIPGHPFLSMDNFIRAHPFFLLRQTSSFTTSQRKAFEMDVFQQARELKLSPKDAEKQIVHARWLCGEKKHHGGPSKLKNEISDSEAVTRRDSVANVDDSDHVENSSSGGNSASVKSLEDATTSTKSSNQEIAKSVLEHQATEALEKVQHKKTNRQTTSGAGTESTFSEIQAPSILKHEDPDNQHCLPQNRLPDSKSDGVNGDPSQLFEVPDDVSWYLDVQAQKKRAKKERLSSASTLDNDTGEVQNDSTSGHGLKDKNLISQLSQDPHDMDDMFRNDERSEKQTDKQERRRSGKKSRKSTADGGVIEPTYPRQKLTYERAQRKARKKERRQERRQQAKANPNISASSTGQASVDAAKNTKGQSEILDKINNLLADNRAEDELKKNSLGKVRDEAVSHPSKPKKRHRPKKKSASMSGFQAPMIQ